MGGYCICINIEKEKEKESEVNDNIFIIEFSINLIKKKIHRKKTRKIKK